MNRARHKLWVLLAGVLGIISLFVAYVILGMIMYHSPSLLKSNIVIACNDTVRSPMEKLANAFVNQYGINVDVRPSSGDDRMLVKAVNESLADIGVLTRGLTPGEAPQGINQVIIARDGSTKETIVLIVRAGSNNDLTKFAYFALGPEGQSILAGEGLTPVKIYPAHVNASQRVEPYAGEFYMRYYHTAESAYVDIIVNNSTLYYTYFDLTGPNVKIDPHDVKQVAIWRPSDLKTIEANLSKSDVEDLVSLVNGTGFMGMNDTYGGADRYQRYYSYMISVKYSGIEKNVTYQSFMGGSPAPDEFKALRDKMMSLVYEYLRADALYLDDTAFDRSQATPTPVSSTAVPDKVMINNVTYVVRRISISPVAVMANS